jgi:hypothetical protein
MSNRIKIFKCFYCDLESEKVEAQGIFYCPNALCNGPGASWFRCKLKSYKENPDGTESVDEEERLQEGKKYMENSEGLIKKCLKKINLWSYR